jgi:FkbM family methyltransferase
MSVSPSDLLGPYATVFDVGAFKGDFARACLAEWPDCSVHSFEPLEPMPAIPATKTSDGRRRWEWHPVAVGNQCDMIEMHRNVFVPSSSVLPMAALHESAFPYTKGSEVVRVGMCALDEFDQEIVPPALLKIDVQGYELEVLKGAGEWLTSFASVVLEVSHETLYEGAPTPEALGEHLHLAGFVQHSTVDSLYHPKSPKLLLQSDELWVRHV